MSPTRHAGHASESAVRALHRMASEVGTEVREERLRRRWTLRDLADRAGISTAHVSAIEAGTPASLETYARVLTALDRRPEIHAIDPRNRAPVARRDEDFVHAAMAELEATTLRRRGFEVAIDEPYQHYQFAGRADVVAWDRPARALLHIENRTRFPNVQESLGSFGSKRAYLGGVLAHRLGIVDGTWRSETHVIAALWTSEVLHVLRLRRTTFAVSCPDPRDRFDAWWSGDPARLAGTSASLVIVDPARRARDGARFAGLDGLPAKPRYRGYAEAARVLAFEAARAPER